MTTKFDLYYEAIIREYTTAKSKRRESRYWKPSMFPGSQVRKVRSIDNRTDSQKTKLGNQQYVGNPYGPNGIRTKNKSEKDYNRAAIAKGLGSHIRSSGVNPKKPGSSVNSKQGNMEVKYTLANGVSKVGSTGKTNYNFIKPKHYK